MMEFSSGLCVDNSIFLFIFPFTGRFKRDHSRGKKMPEWHPGKKKGGWGGDKKRGCAAIFSFLEERSHLCEAEKDLPQ